MIGPNEINFMHPNVGYGKQQQTSAQKELSNEKTSVSDNKVRKQSQR